MAEVYPGDHYCWSTDPDGSRSKPDRIAIVIHTSGREAGRGRMDDVDATLYVGPNSQFDFRDPERRNRGGGRMEYDHDSGLLHSRMHDGFCGFMQTAMMRAAGVEPRRADLDERIAHTTMARFVIHFGEVFDKVVQAAYLRGRQYADSVGHLGVMCKIGRHRSNACAYWIYHFLLKHEFQVQLRCHAPRKTHLDNRGPCGCLFGRCTYESDRQWTARMLEARECAQAAFDRIADACFRRSS